MAEVNGLNNLGGVQRAAELAPKPTTAKTSKDASLGQGFDSILRDSLGGKVGPSINSSNAESGVKFSAHAIERLKSRGISLDQDTLKRLNSAIDKAAEKGSKESLMLTDDAAFIVSVKNKTVITAMDRGSIKDNVFTNIDSTVFV